MLIVNKIGRRKDSNRGSLVSEASALPTEPQPLSISKWHWHWLAPLKTNLEHSVLSLQSISGWKPCVAEVDDFTTIFLFSLETQHSIGYGTREITKECASAMILMSLQSIFGTLVSMWWSWSRISFCWHNYPNFLDPIPRTTGWRYKRLWSCSIIYKKSCPFCLLSSVGTSWQEFSK